MAMLASQSKGGFYPTPLVELSFIYDRLIGPAGGSINLLDPCCGKGVALEGIAQSLQQVASVRTYGVELELERAEEAILRLDYVIYDGYESIRTENKFSLLYLNPPYDNGFAERVETTFLRNLTGRRNVLQDGGILIFVVPQSTLENAAGVLATRFKDIGVYRFSDAHFDEFDQVVLFATFGKPSEQEKKQNFKWLKELSTQPKEQLLSLDHPDGITYSLLASETVDCFRASPMSDIELAKDLMSSDLFVLTAEIFDNRTFDVEFSNPILELKPMHYGIAVASNTVSGNMGTHLLVGGTKKVTTKADKTNEDGDVEGEETREYFKSRVRIFSPSGVFDLE